MDQWVKQKNVTHCRLWAGAIFLGLAIGIGFSVGDLYALWLSLGYAAFLCWLR